MAEQEREQKETPCSTVTSKVVNSRGHVRPRKYKTKYSEHFQDEYIQADTNFKQGQMPFLSAHIHDETNDDLKRRKDISSHATKSTCMCHSENICNIKYTISNGNQLQESSTTDMNIAFKTGQMIETDFQKQELCLQNVEAEHDIDTGENETPLQTGESAGNSSYAEQTESTNTFGDQFVQSAETGNDANLMDSESNTLIEDLLSKLKDDNETWKSYDDDSYMYAPENDERQDEVAAGEEPVQPGHTLLTSSSVLLIWMFIICHSLTAAQVSDLLALINLHLVVSNSALKSLHHFKKIFSQMKTPIIKHYFCTYCFTGVQADTKQCPNKFCGKDTTLKKGKDFFIELEIVKQLENLFARKEFRNNLSHRSMRIKKNRNNIEDIYDGLVYRSFSKPGGILHHENVNNVSFVLNTDGVPIFKSSKTSIWPIFLMINELPFKMRKQRENMILCGLWFGQEKPMMNMFFDPLQKSLINLQTGININISENSFITVKGFLMCLSCDIPARSAVLNMNQHNGESSCPKCLQKGVNTRTAAGGNIRTFPFNTENLAGPERSSLQVVKSGIEASEKNITVNGIKGVSFLMFTPNFDMVKNIGIDYMHSVCLGIVRLLLKLWFSTDFSSEDFSMYVDIVDSRIEHIKPSHFITRTPRTISDNLKFWKAAELRSWLFYYSVPCTLDLLKPLYLYHYCALLEGVYILCQSSISEQDINRSEQLLNYFVFMFGTIYGDRYVTLNMHSLLHLPQTVRELGPLWGHSCFAFEGANGDLLKMFHGTMFIDLQIVNAVHVFQMIPLLSQKIEQNSLAGSLVKSLTKRNTVSHDSGTYSFCGRPYSKELPPNLRIKVCEYIQNAIYSISFYNRAVIRGIVYHSIDYTRVSMRNSYTVKFLDSSNRVSYGFLVWFASHTAVNDKHTDFACISKLNPIHLDIFSLHHDADKADHHIQSNFMNIKMHFMHIVTPSETVEIIPLTNVLDLCICIDQEKFKIVCEEPNHHELNL